MSDSVSSLSLPNGSISRVASSPQSQAPDLFGTHMQDAMQAVSAPGNRDASTPPPSGSSQNGVGLQSATAAGPDHTANRSGSSRSVNHHLSGSGSSANRPDTAQAKPMDTDVQSADQNEPPSVETDTGADRAISTATAPALEQATADLDSAGDLAAPAGATGPARPTAGEAATGKNRKRTVSHDAAARSGPDEASRTGTPTNTPQPSQTVTDDAGPGVASTAPSADNHDDAGSGQPSNSTAHVGHGGGTARAAPTAAREATPPGATGDPSVVAANPMPAAAPDAASLPLVQQQALPSTIAAAVTGSGTTANATARPGAGVGGSETPMAQVAGPAVTLMQSADGSSSMSVSLHPKDLGKDLGEVRVRLDRDADGAVRVVVAATEPATLRSLMAEQSHLHAALDAASLPAGDRQISFELDSTPSGGGVTQDPTTQSGTGNDTTGGEQRRDRQSHAQHWNGFDAGAADGDDRPTSLPAFMSGRPGSYRAGVNITA